MVDGQLSKKLKISIGDIGISVTANNRFKIDNNYSLFLSRGRSEVILRGHYGFVPQIELGEKIFDNPIWALHRSNEKFILCVHHPEPRSASITKLGVFQHNFESGDIYLGREASQTDSPLNYPLDQILMINLLSQGKGLLVHSCGIDNSGEGLLFVGSSGAGKSTLARLGINKKGVKVLSDDRVIVRQKDGEFLIYGTPWHGDAKICSPEKAPLKKILFLKHAENNIIKKIGPVDAASRLIVCSFPTFWDKKGMEFVLKFCTKLVQKVTCCEMGFVPDESVLNLVL
jgi:hypothetical protein